MAQQLTKTGVVKAVDGITAVVVTKLDPGCESCKAKNACSSLGGTGANVQVRARNTAGAQAGDVVTIGLRSASLLKVTFLVYMVPILALLGGIVLGYFLAKLFSVDENILVGILAGLALVGSFIWVKKKGDKFSERQEFVPEVISKQSPTKAVLPADISCPVKQ